MEHTVLSVAIIGVLGIFCQWIAWRTKTPAILVLLLSGLTIGPFTGILDPDKIFGDLLLPIVSISVGIILFEGGLSLKLDELKEIGKEVINLVTIGVIITWVLASAFAFYIFDISEHLAILLGGILVVTGPTVIIPMLRQVQPKGQIASLLKWEGIVIDPVGVLLAVLIFEALFGVSHDVTNTVGSVVFKSIFIGGSLGLSGAYILTKLLKNYLVADFLVNSVFLSLVVFVFALSNHYQHESGLLAVTVMGVALANQKEVTVKQIIHFKEDLRVLLISSIFIILSARLDIELIREINIDYLIYVLALIFIVRPVSVFLSTIRSKSLSFKEKLFISFVAPRGIVAASISSVFAIEIANSGILPMNESIELVKITFVVVIATVAFYSITAPILGKMLNLVDTNKGGVLFVGAQPWAVSLAKVLRDNNVLVRLVDSNPFKIKAAQREGLDASESSIFDDYDHGVVELSGIGAVLSVTSNHEVNTLSSIHFSELVGKASVYQLSKDDMSLQKHDKDKFSGRVLFSQDMSFRKFNMFYSQGASFEIITLTKEDVDLFKSEVGDLDRIPLFLVTDTKAEPIASDSSKDYNEGDKLIVLSRVAVLSKLQQKNHKY